MAGFQGGQAGNQVLLHGQVLQAEPSDSELEYNSSDSECILEYRKALRALS